MTSKPLIEVAPILTGNGFVPEDVTALIQLAPTKTWRLGDPIQRTDLRRKDDEWVFGLRQRETFDMNGLLMELLCAIERHNDKIAEASKQYSLNAVISFGVYVRGETPASWFASETISRVAALGASLDIDLILAA